MAYLGPGSDDLVNFPAIINNYFYIVHCPSGLYLKNPLYKNKWPFATKKEADNMITKLCTFTRQDWKIYRYDYYKINTFLCAKMSFDEFLVVGGSKNI